MLCCKGGPKAPVTATKRLASGGGDHMVRVWRLVSTISYYCSTCSCYVREDSNSWICEDKLEAHTDWVRDVAWAPSIGLPRSRLASCSQVSQLHHDVLVTWSILGL